MSFITSSLNLEHGGFRRLVVLRLKKILIQTEAEASMRTSFVLLLSQVRTRAGIRAMETTGTRVMVTKAMVDTVAMATMTTLLVTIVMVLDMITVSIHTHRATSS